MVKPKPLFGPFKSLFLFFGIIALRWFMMIFCLALTALFLPAQEAVALAQVASVIIMIAIVYFYLVKLENYFPRDFGFIPLGEKGKNLLYQIPLAILIATLGFILDNRVSEEGIQYMGPSGVRLPFLVLLYGLVIILNPILNQFLHRKLLNDALGRFLGPWLITIISSIALSFFVPEGTPIFYTFVSIVLANVLYFRYQSLWAPILFMSALGLFEVSGGLMALANIIR